MENYTHKVILIPHKIILLFLILIYYIVQVKIHFMKTLNKIQLKSVLGGDELRKLRNEICYSQEYMAKQLGITQSTYQRLESGEIKISVDRFIKISEILNNSKNIFFTQNDNDLIIINKMSDEIITLNEIIESQKNHIKNLELLIKHN